MFQSEKLGESPGQGDSRVQCWVDAVTCGQQQVQQHGGVGVAQVSTPIPAGTVMFVTYSTPIPVGTVMFVTYSTPIPVGTCL